MALAMPIPKGTRGVAELPNTSRKVLTLGTLTISGISYSLVTTAHSDERMHERQKRQFETILSAVRALGDKLSTYTRTDEVMVNVTNGGLSFVLGFAYVGFNQIRILTVIQYPYAHAREGTHLERVSL